MRTRRHRSSGTRAATGPVFESGLVQRVAVRVATAVLVARGVAAAPPTPETARSAVATFAPVPLVEAVDAFGPFRFGMAVEDALAIAPGFDWYEDRNPGYGRKRAVTADGGWHLGERTYDVTLAPGYHGAYELELQHTSTVGEAAACRDAVVALATEFERRFGGLTGPVAAPSAAAPGHISVQRTAEGYPFVTVEPGDAAPAPGPGPEVLDVGEHSSLAMLPIEDDLPGARSWYSRRGPVQDQPYRVAVDGRFSQVEGAPTCRVTGSLARAGEVPREVWLDVANTAFARSPSIAVLHHSLDAYLQPPGGGRGRDLADLPAAGVEVTMDCAVRRDTGALADCRAEGRGTPALVEVVQRRLPHLRFDPRAIDRRDPAPLRAKAVLRVAPGDRVDLGPVPTTLRALREVTWAERPTGADLERAYPRDALRKEIQARVAASCRLQPDLSAVCTSAVVYPAGDARNTHAFSLAAYEVLTKFRARDLLRDGVTPAAGEWFTGSMSFVLGD